MPGEPNPKGSVYYNNIDVEIYMLQLLFRFGGVYHNSIPWTRREHGCGMISPFFCDCLHGCSALVLLSFGAG